MTTKSSLSFTPSTSYGDVTYWNSRYAGVLGDKLGGPKTTTFDWFGQWSPFADKITEAAVAPAGENAATATLNKSDPNARKLTKASSKVLIIGTGNSRLPVQMFDEGWVNITAIDYSSVVIDAMSKAWSEKKGIEWMVMDATKLDLPSESYDLVIMKGSLDAMLCAQRGRDVAATALKETSRVIKPGGALVVISAKGPSDRQPVLEREALKWTGPAEHTEYPDCKAHMYVLRRSTGMPSTPRTPRDAPGTPSTPASESEAESEGEGANIAPAA